jgi:broad specificity phosphatase PhoE
LQRASFDFAITSDLLRARETAEIVLGARSCPLETDPRWRELYFGAWEGLTRAEIDARTPPMSQGPPGTPVRFPTPEGGESFDAFNVRIAAALRSVRDRMRTGGRALVATHAGPLHAVLRGLLGEAEAAALDVKFVPASITTFVVEPHAARLTALNRTAAPLSSAGAERGRE